jgi:hypothetical protein
LEYSIFVKFDSEKNPTQAQQTSVLRVVASPQLTNQYLLSGMLQHVKMSRAPEDQEPELVPQQVNPHFEKKSSFKTKPAKHDPQAISPSLCTTTSSNTNKHHAQTSFKTIVTTDDSFAFGRYYIYIYIYSFFYLPFYIHSGCLFFYAIYLILIFTELIAMKIRKRNSKNKPK